MADLSIANEIRNQLITLGRIKVWSWGAHGWVGGKNFLQFKVNGLKFKGWVRITLNGMDLYDIQFMKKGEVVVKELNGIYFDEMVDLIDGVVESNTPDQLTYNKEQSEKVRKIHGL